MAVPVAVAMAAAKPFLPSSLLPAPPRRTEPRRCRCLGVPVGPRRPRRQGRGALAAVARLSLFPDPLFLLDVSAAAGDVGYSQASYYTSLGLFVISVPGLWSLIKRSVKSKVPSSSTNASFLDFRRSSLNF